MFPLLDTAAVKKINGEKHGAAALQITCLVQLLSEGSNKQFYKQVTQETTHVLLSLTETTDGCLLAWQESYTESNTQKYWLSESAGKPKAGHGTLSWSQNIDIISQITKIGGMTKKRW